MTADDFSNVSNDWIPLGTVKLKIDDVYDQYENLSLSKATHFASCSYGGPIAIAQLLNNTRWVVHFRTASGRKLGEKTIGDIFGMEWTRGQRLVILDRNGCASLFTAKGIQEGSFYFSKDPREVKEFRIFHHGSRGSGMAVLDDQMRFFVVNTVAEPIVWTMQLPTKDVPTAWTAIHPHSSITSLVVVVGKTFHLGLQGEPIRAVDTPWAEPDGQYCRISSDWECTRFTVYHSSKIIQIVSADLDKVYYTIPVPGEHSIYRLGWIGTEAVFLQRTPNLIQFFAVDGSESVHEYENEFMQLGVEPDGVKIFKNTSLQFVAPVSAAEQRVLGVASSSYGAFLYEASLLAARQASSKAYEYSLLAKDMNEAIKQCLEAAQNVNQPALQKLLLKAAHFGFPFTSNFVASQSADMVKIIRNLRLLNEVRMARTGVPITYRQLEQLTTKVLINRLVDTHCFGVGVRVSALTEDMQQEGVDAVLLAWVKSILETASKNPDLADVEKLDQCIAAKFAGFPHVSFADAAKKAIDARLPRLARLLIKRESDEERQVDILLLLHDVADALKLAAQSQRPELMHLVIRHLMKTKQKSQYELEIQKIPQAQCLYAEYVTQEKGGTLGESGAKMLALLEQGSDYERKLLFHLDAACQTHPAFSQAEHLTCLKKAKEAATQLRDPGIADVVTQSLATASADWDVNTTRDYIIKNASNASAVQAAKQLAKLTDKQVILWTIEGLAKDGRWEQLFSMASKKSMVGYVPFVKACLKYNRRQECDRYMSKITTYSDQVAVNLLLENFVTAAKLAFDRKDHELLHRIFMKSHKKKEQYAKVSQLMQAL